MLTASHPGKFHSLPIFFYCCPCGPVIFFWSSLTNVVMFNRLENFVRMYKVNRSHATETADSVNAAVRDIMDEILQGIVGVFPDNPTLPDGSSRAETPSPL